MMSQTSDAFYDAALRRIITERVMPGGGFITFIIPTTGRITLARTLLSLTGQHYKDWRAIVLLDGNQTVLKKNALAIANAESARIWILQLDHRRGGQWSRGHGQAGNVRNVAFHYVRTEWIGFVDDDDTIGPDYASRVATDAANYDCISFRMRWAPWAPGQFPYCYGYGCDHGKNTTLSEVLPEWNATFLQKGHTGISFAIRKNVTNTLRFHENMFEDYYMHQAIFRRRMRTMQSPHVTYYVKGEPRPEARSGVRLIDPVVCTGCPRPVKATVSYEYQLARELAANDETFRGYDGARQWLMRILCAQLGNSSADCSQREAFE